MSLEECKRLAEKKLAKEKEIQKETRRSRGMVDGEDVRVCLSMNDSSFIPIVPFVLSSKRWVVAVSAYGELSSKYFIRKVPAEEYFKELTQEYGLKEEEK